MYRTILVLLYPRCCFTYRFSKVPLLLYVLYNFYVLLSVVYSTGTVPYSCVPYSTCSCVYTVQCTVYSCTVPEGHVGNDNMKYSRRCHEIFEVVGDGGRVSVCVCLYKTNIRTNSGKSEFFITCSLSAVRKGF